MERIGPQHQAGSDALLTACTFFKLQRTYFHGPTAHLGAVDKYMGVLYGARADRKRRRLRARRRALRSKRRA